MINIKEWEKVMMFRCVQDPMIGPRPRNAFMLPDLPGWEAWFHTPTGTVHVKAVVGSGAQQSHRRHIVPTGNLSSIELFKEDPIGQTKDEAGKGAETNQEKLRGPGRSRKEGTLVGEERL